MSGFVEVEVTTDPKQLEDAAIDKWAEILEGLGITGWTPSPGNGEIIQIGAVAPMAANAATVASVVSPAIFRAYGTKLVKVPYNEGAAATVSTLWTLTDTAGHTIPAGTTVEAGGFAFYVQEDTVVTAGHSTVTLNVVASERGTEYNGLSGVLSLTNSIDWVREATIVGESSGGANQEEDSEYENRLTGGLALQAARPVNADDFAPMAFNAPSSILPSGVVVGRTTAIDLYNAETHEENVERCTTVFVTDPEGHALTSEARTAIKTWLEGFLPWNFLVFVESASYTKLYVTVEIHCLPEYAKEAVAANAQAAILAYLNPQSWGNPSAQTTGVNSWLNSTAGFNIVRFNKLVGLVESVPGVDYVPTGQLKLGTAPSPAGTVDVTMTGPAPLPESEPSTILVTAV